MLGYGSKQLGHVSTHEKIFVKGALEVAHICIGTRRCKGTCECKCGCIGTCECAGTWERTGEYTCAL